ncbi:hypothetical protein FA95DRAFT_1679233 [Auriscalpium vulgare]|uniref:Uncharacterized protein n=1 Tax=Auriscalpium vulgare TaxID=40419 RepID=A0ACB8RUH9_9AGAM|nr:hypothetical protein FA95DRAFT_1679233 [Auriscalpium vulgare]
MSAHSDVEESSDVDERDAIDALNPLYWDLATAAIRAHADVLHHLVARAAALPPDSSRNLEHVAQSPGISGNAGDDDELMFGQEENKPSPGHDGSETAIMDVDDLLAFETDDAADSWKYRNPPAQPSSSPHTAVSPLKASLSSHFRTSSPVSSPRQGPVSLSPPSPSPDPLSLSMPATVLPQSSPSVTQDTPAEPPADIDADIIIDIPLPEEHVGRYSLRPRALRQKQPYAYDQAIYKHALKDNPDAIVKVTSDRVRRGSPLLESQEFGEEDPDDAPPAVRERRRHDKTKHPRPDASNRQIAAPPRQEQRNGKSAPSPDRLRWLPSAYLDSSSDSEVSGVGPFAGLHVPKSCSPDNRAHSWPMSSPPHQPAGENSPSTSQRDVQSSQNSEEDLRGLQEAEALSQRSDSELSQPASLEPNADDMPVSGDSHASRSPPIQAYPLHDDEAEESDDVISLSDGSAIEDNRVSIGAGRSRTLKPNNSFKPKPTSVKSRPRAQSNHRSKPKLTSTKLRSKAQSTIRHTRPTTHSTHPHRGMTDKNKTSTSTKRKGTDSYPVEHHETTSTHKRRRLDKRGRTHGLSTFETNNRVVSRLERRNAITIDMEDSELHNALAPARTRTPLSRHPSVASNALGGPAPAAPALVPVGYRPYRQQDLRTYLEPGRQGIQSDALPSLTTSAPVAQLSAPPPDKPLKRVTADLGVPFLPIGHAFGPDSYTGRGWLHELLRLVHGGRLEIPPPDCVLPSGRLEHTASVPDFIVFLQSASDYIFDSATSFRADEFVTFDATLHTICLLASWMAVTKSDDQYPLLWSSLLEVSGTLIARADTQINGSSQLDAPLFRLYWFALELVIRGSCRGKPVDEECGLVIEARMTAFVHRLIDFGMQKALEPALAGNVRIDTYSADACVAELWICLINLTHSPPDDPPSPAALRLPTIWGPVQQVLTAHGASHHDLQASEDTWHIIFGICALSQFSAHGYSTSTLRAPAAWDLVCFALDRIRLDGDLEGDKKLARKVVRLRDTYVRLIVYRCYLLVQRWHWRLGDGAAPMFNRIVVVFRTRKFADLARERPGFLAFLKEREAGALASDGAGDSAFTLFLKLVVASAEAIKIPGADTGDASEYAKKVKKLLTAMPVTSVQFSNVEFPEKHELSMLYNRFSAVAVAIHVHPSPSNFRQRLSTARHFLDFASAAGVPREIYIEGFTHLALQALHLRLPLNELLDWSAEMADILVAEHDGTAADVERRGAVEQRRARAKEGTKLLLNSYAKWVRASMAGPDGVAAACPRPELLQRGCVARLLSAPTDLLNSPSVADAVQNALRVFLDALLDALPAPAGAQIESQDDYGQPELDWDDPELLRALGSDAGPSPPPIDTPIQVLTQVVATTVAPVLYRLVSQYSGDTVAGSERHRAAMERWVDCWVTAAHICVRGGKQDWSMYFYVATYSWGRIGDTAWRRRVAVKFMLALLELDPSSYKEYEDQHLHVWLEALVAADLASAARYLGTLLARTADTGPPPLLSGLPEEVLDGLLDVGASDRLLQTLRRSAFEAVCRNFNVVLAQSRRADPGTAASQLALLPRMLAALGENLEALRSEAKPTALETYTTFAEHAVKTVRSYPSLAAYPTIAIALRWFD